MGELIPKPYNGPLNPVDAANAIRASRLNAVDLLETAEVLFTLKRFAHSMVFSILSIEESAKHAIVFLLAVSDTSDHPKLWKSYRSHRAKTEYLNPAIESRVRAVFPQAPRDAAKEIGKAGSSSEELEYYKQMALYSDCKDVSGEFVAHLPQNAEWRIPAWHRMCEAQTLVHGLRDRTPEELRIWLRHMKDRPEGTTTLDVLRRVHAELLDQKLIETGWWDTLLKDAESELGDADEGHSA